LATLHADLGEDDMALADLDHSPGKDDKSYPLKLMDVCRELGRSGHTEAALRCAARIAGTGSSASVRRLLTYSDILAGMAR
jgi:hypothetical protein